MKPLKLKHRQRPDDAVLRAADSAAPALARGLLLAFNDLKASGSLADFKVQLGTLQAHLDAARAAGAATIRARFVAKAGIGFDLGADLPQATADALSGYDYGMVREVSADVRNTIAQVVTRGMAAGLAPDRIAREVKAGIGLTATQEAALNNYRNMLEQGDAGALDRRLRDKRSDGLVQAAVDGTKQLSPEQIDSLVNRYEQRYVAYRANTIARYETLRASNQGAIDAVQQAVDDGTLPEGRVTKNWLISDDERLCARCRSVVDIQPDGVALDENFTWRVVSRKGTERTGVIGVPPLHPSCRCSATYSVDGEPVSQ